MSYLIDLKHAVITDVEVTTAVRQAEVTAAKAMTTRTAGRPVRRRARATGGRKKVEKLFAHLKRILKVDRPRLRGPCSARDEFL
jgi:hypothetical protein